MAGAPLKHKHLIFGERLFGLRYDVAISHIVFWFQTRDSRLSFPFLVSLLSSISCGLGWKNFGLLYTIGHLTSISSRWVASKVHYLNPFSPVRPETAGLCTPHSLPTAVNISRKRHARPSTPAPDSRLARS